MKLPKAIKMLKNAGKIPEAVKKEYAKHPMRSSIETTVINRVMNNDKKGFIKLIDKASVGKRLGFFEIKKLKELVRRLKKSKGLDKPTKYAINVGLPKIINRLEKMQATEKDKLFLKEELLPFVEWAFEQETVRLMQERNVV